MSKHVSRPRGVLFAVALLTVASIGLSACSGDGGGDKQSAKSNTPSSTKAPNAGASGSASPPPETTAPAGPPQPCGARQLSGAEAGSSLQTANNVQVYAFSITNDSNKACTLTGYPAIELLGPDDQVLTATVQPGGGAIRPELVESTVTLDPGGQASFVTSWQPVPAAGQSQDSCRDVRKIRFTPPGSTIATTISTLVTVCADGLVNVSPIQPGVVTG